jgi:hypothetical protein
MLFSCVRSCVESSRCVNVFGRYYRCGLLCIALLCWLCLLLWCPWPPCYHVSHHDELSIVRLWSPTSPCCPIHPSPRSSTHSLHRPCQDEYQAVQRLQLDGKKDESDFAPIVARVAVKKLWLDSRRPFLKSMMTGAKNVGKEKKEKKDTKDKSVAANSAAAAA